MAIKVPEVLDNKTPGSLIDMVFALREERKLWETKAELIKEQEDRIKEHLIQRMTKEELKALSGRVAKCSLTETIKPNVKDWDVLNEYITSHDAWDLRNKAANAAAFRARWEAGEEIPGVEKFKDISINVRKL